MSSRPPRDSMRQRAREKVQSSVRWFQDALRPSSSSRPSSQRSGHSPVPPADTRSPSPAVPGTPGQETTTQVTSHLVPGAAGPLTAGGASAPVDENTIRSPSPTAPESPSQKTTTQPIPHPTPGAAELSTSGGASTSVGAGATTTPGPEPSTYDKLKEASSIAWAGLETSLRVLEKSADVFPPLKSAVEGFLACLDVVKAATSNREDYQGLVSELTATIDTLNKYKDELKLEDQDGIVARIALSIQEETTRINKHQDRGRLRRLLESMQDQEDVIQCYRRVETSFRQLQNNVNLQTLRNTSKQLEVTLLQSLSPEEDARYDSAYSTTVKRRACTAETREKVQADLRSWVKDPNGAKVYWMNGMAGTGKTTIAYSLCEWLKENKLLGGSFFCSRTAASCRNVSRIVPTIACQLARYSSAYRSALCDVLQADTGVGKLNVVQQFEKLVKAPLLKANTSISHDAVIVIDALDECEDTHTVRLILATLMRLAAALPLKFFVASRPEPVIREQMLSSKDYSPFVLLLHDIEDSLVEEDIKKYLKEVLGFMLPPPSDSQVEQLAKRAGKLFIYAATVARYIFPGDIRVHSSARLQMMLSIDSTSPIKNATSATYGELDQLYTTILSAAFDPRLGTDEQENMRLVLRTVVCAREPMNVQTLAPLLGLTDEQVALALEPLHSVLHISTGVGLVSTLHASFPDYLFDQSRSGESYWHCDDAQHNDILAHRCFDMMKEKLRFNICKLETSFAFDKDVPDLENRIEGNIPPALFYACRYWGDHLGLAGASNPLCDKLVDFLAFRLLFWMEVMNLKQCIVSGAQVLLHAQDWLTANGSPLEARKHVDDARNFVIRFAASACTRSTPHLYLSALPFCPKSSSVYEHYWGCTRGLIDGKGTAMPGEYGSLATWRTGSANRAVAFSPDGTRIVSGSDDNTILVWDAHSGDIVAGPFKGHSSSVRSVAFSPDGTRIVSGSNDKTIRVWDAHTGAVVAEPLQGHSSSVQSVAFSPDGTRIVSGSADKTIRMWDAHTGDAVAGSFKGHSDSVNSVAFSPDGTRIVSGSGSRPSPFLRFSLRSRSTADNTIRVWDARTGDLVAGPFQGHSSRVNSVAFSPDGTRIVSGSDDKTARVWDVRTGDVVAGPFKGHSDSVQSVAFSPDGTRIVSGSDDETTRVWNVHTGDVVVGPLKGHSDSVQSVAFSPDGTRIVSGSNDTTIRVWDAHTGDAVAGSFKGHSKSVNSVAFSPDGTRIVSGSGAYSPLSLLLSRRSDNIPDNTIRVWDARTGDLVAGPFRGHSSSVQSVAFSPDGTRIVSGSGDKTIRVWDAHTGDVVARPFKGHSSSVQSVAFSPDGARIVSGSADQTTRVWDVHTGDVVVGPLKGHSSTVWAVAFSPDGTRVVSGATDQTIRVWDVHTGDVVAGPFKGHSLSVQSVAFSPDGTRIVSGSADETTRVWDVHTGDVVVGPLKGHSDSVQSVAFSPDGTRIVSGSDDKTIRVWDAHTGDVVAGPFKGHSSSVQSVAFSPDGARIVSGSRDKTIRVWDARARAVVAGPFIRDDLKFVDDGWIVQAANNLPLLWISPELHMYIPYPPQIFVIGPQGSVCIESWSLLLGNDWSKCYTTSS